jgi:hypothetical protein
VRTTVTKTFSLPPAVAATLTDKAEEEGLPESLIVRWALEKFFSDAKRKTAYAAKAAERKRTK